MDYQYAKERRRFGRQCLFSEQNKVLESMQPDPNDAKQFILKNPVANETQLSKQMALSEMNTENAEYVSRGMYHYEGGWPKDVNMLDEEQTLRYRKKIEREDQYPIQMNHVLGPMIHLVNQNNAVNLYENYFDDLAPVPPVVAYNSRIVQCFQYPSDYDKAPANHISFSPEGGEEMAVAYSYTKYQSKQLDDTRSYIWRIDNPQITHQKLNCSSPATRIEYNFRDGRVLAGGLLNGKVCTWDTRSGGNPTKIIEIEHAHRTRITSLMWLHSKSNCEFYSGSSDGRLYFWDTRKFKTPIDTLCCDPVRTEDQELNRSFGVSVLEFEPTIPTKYLVGTEEGWVFFGNRKGVTVADKLPLRINANNGPVRSLERNPLFVKNFMTVGEFRVKIFNDECRDNPIMWTRNQNFELTCGCWSRTRCSLFFTGRLDGIVDCWDIVTDLRLPIVSLKVSTVSICYMRAHESGLWLACGDLNGDVFMVELSPALTVSDRNDRSLLSAMFEREVKKEKILEARMREIKLKEKLDEEERERKLIASKTKSKSSDKVPAEDVPEGGVAPGARKSQQEAEDETVVFFMELIKREQVKRDRKKANQKE